MIAAGNNKLWASVCEVVGLPALLADDRFATTTLRAQNQTALKGLLEEQFAKRNAADWVKAFQDAGVPCSPIQKYSQALQDPQAVHLQLVNDQQLPGHQTKTVGCPVWLSGQPVAVDTSVETLGQSNDQEQPWRNL